MEKERKMNVQFEKLRAPFLLSEISFKLTSTTKDKKRGQVAAYVSNPAIQNRLDEVFTPFGWQCKFREWKNNNGQICTIYIYDSENKCWIYKEDGAGDTNIESIKGGISDSMKRCARMLGIGRYLASDKVIKNSWVTLDDYNRISEQDMNRLRNEYASFLKNFNSNNASSSHIDSNKLQTNSEKMTTDYNNQIEQEKKNTNASGKPDQTNNTMSIIPAPLINAINELIKSKRTDINSVLKYYNISDISQLTFDQANDAMKRLMTQKTA